MFIKFCLDSLANIKLSAASWIVYHCYRFLNQTNFSHFYGRARLLKNLAYFVQSLFSLSVVIATVVIWRLYKPWSVRPG